MRGLKDKIVFVTGAASGIGLATTRRFLDEGARVVAVDLHPTAIDGVRFVAADVASPAGLEAITQAMAGGIDVLVNNAGITRDASLAKLSADDWDKVIAVN